MLRKSQAKSNGSTLAGFFSSGWFSPAGKLGRNRTEHISMIPDEIAHKVRDAVTRGIWVLSMKPLCFL